MIPSLDAYAALPSPLSRWEPRCKIAGLGALILASSFLRDWRALALAVAWAVCVVALSKLPLRFLLTRMRVPAVFLVVIGLMLPWIEGNTVLVELGPLALRSEGLQVFGTIVVKFAVIFAIGVVLFGSAPLAKSIRAMRGLGMPRLLADLMLFSYRFVHEIGADLERMRTAARLRGYETRRFGRRGLTTTISLAASLLLRSHERAETVHRAMLLRGYGGEGDRGLQRRPGVGEVAVAVGAAGVAAAGVVLDLWLRGWMTGMLPWW